MPKGDRGRKRSGELSYENAIRIREKLPVNFNWNKTMTIFDNRNGESVQTTNITKGLELISQQDETTVIVDYGSLKNAVNKLEKLGFEVKQSKVSNPSVTTSVILHLKKKSSGNSELAYYTNLKKYHENRLKNTPKTATITRDSIQASIDFATKKINDLQKNKRK